MIRKQDGIYPFNRSFRIKLLALCLDPKWMARHRTIIKPEYFEQDDEEAIASAILDYLEAYGTVPTDACDVITLCNEDYEDTVYDVFDSVDDVDTRLAADVAIQFAQEQAAKIAILDSIDDVKVGNISDAIERMKAALAVGKDLSSPAIDVVGDVDSWMYELWTDKVSTGWPHIDAILEGGLSPGEIGLIMGPTNRGKTMALVNLGIGAASIGSGKNVVHITHELSGKLTAKRYAARMMFRFPKREENIDTYRDEFVEVARGMLPGRIRILDMTGNVTVADIRAKLDMLISIGYKFDLIIDDYPDLVTSPRAYDQRRFELTGTHTAFRQMGSEYGVPVWAATQSNRASFSKEVITVADVAEDIGKANNADVIVAMCQTREEEDTDRCRLFMAKVRDGTKHQMVGAKYIGASQAIVTTGLVKRKKDNDV